MNRNLEMNRIREEAVWWGRFRGDFRIKDRKWMLLVCRRLNRSLALFMGFRLSLLQRRESSHLHLKNGRNPQKKLDNHYK